MADFDTLEDNVNINTSQSNGYSYQRIFINSYAEQLKATGSTSGSKALNRMLENDIWFSNIDSFSVANVKKQADIMYKSIRDLYKNEEFKDDIQNDDPDLSPSEEWALRKVKSTVFFGKLFFPSVNSIVTKIASGLSGKEIGDYLVTKAKTVFNAVSNVSPDGKASIAYGEFNRDNVKEYVEAFRDVKQLRDQRPWYQRWFFKEKPSITNAYDKVRDFLKGHGVDEKSLNEYLSSSDSNKDKAFDKLWAASEEEIGKKNESFAERYKQVTEAKKEAEDKEIEREIALAAEAEKDFAFQAEAVDEQKLAEDNLDITDEILQDKLFEDIHAEDEILFVADDEAPESEKTAAIESDLSAFK